MRYLSVPDLERYESAAIPPLTGKHYSPSGPLTLNPGSRLSHPAGTTFVDLDGEMLVIHPDTASWAFLSPAELAGYRALDGTTAAELAVGWPGSPPAAMTFAQTAFRRGLLTVDGVAAVDPTIFRDGHNTPEAHLVELLVTEKCNLGCVYCLAGTTPKMPRMTSEIALKAVDLAFEMAEAQSLSFELSGGEPFLEFPLMQEIVRHIMQRQRADGRPVSLNIQTNCTLLNAERVQWVADNDINIGISLDGSPTAHDRSRPLLGGKGSFEQVIAGIDLLQRAGVPFGALVVLNRWNIGDPRILAEFLVENGIVGFKLNPVAYLGTARGAWNDIGVGQEEVVDYLRDLAKLIADEGFCLVESNLRAMCEYLVSKRRAVRCMRTHCGAGDSFQAVTANGDIYPCGRSTQSPGLRLGSVHQEGISSLSGPARRSLVISEIRSRRPHDLDGCDVCEYRQLCQAGCSAEAFERFGTVRHKTPECHLYKSGYPWLMRWLTFDDAARDQFSRMHYFGSSTVELFSQDFAGRELVAL